METGSGEEAEARLGSQSGARTDVVVIGGGQAGLAMSRVLGAHGVEHVVLERGRVAERWRSERWDSLRLLTPNWLGRLPGAQYCGDAPNGFMSANELAARLERYAQAFNAPLRTETRVLSVCKLECGYRVQTDQGVLRARAVVIATGDADVPFVPALATGLAPGVHQQVPARYRRPDQLPPGGVLIVGASAAGAQLADELQRAGRKVVLAVGRHLRVPRSYRGRDLFYWLDRMGRLSERARDVRDLAQAKRIPSYQLIGRDGGPGVDLAALQALGVQLTGRVLAADGQRVSFGGDLDASSAQADDRLERLLDRIDAFALASGLAREIEAPERPARVAIGRSPTRLQLAHAGLSNVIWATGYRRSYPWLQVPGALDAAGELLHSGGVLRVPGLFALGLRFMRRRDSHFLD
ncbi:MAG TPA: NAD(P)-binding domain-containing protein, partial [Polyangiales bacterium]|nr:NAD(P)-binding domain-containing protein [Polyangiales bacterium]